MSYRSHSSFIPDQASIDPSALFQPGAVTLPKGDWYVEPPVEGDYTIHAQSDGARGQYISMTYSEGFQAFVHIDLIGVLRFQLFRYNEVWPAEVEYGGLKIRFRDVQASVASG